MAVTKHAFSQDGAIDEYVLSNSSGTEVYVTTWGARLTRFIVKDKAGELRDIVPGFESYEQWQESLAVDDPYFGATIGRVAGRIWPCDQVEIDGRRCQLPEIQPDKVCLHGGKHGFDKKVFAAKVVSIMGPAAVQFAYMSADGDEGFAGGIELRVTYSLDDTNALHIQYDGRLVAGTETILNPTNHTYWNLTGFAEPTIRNHVCRLRADHYMGTRTSPPLVPDGRLLPTAGTALDFATPRRLGDDLDSFDKSTSRGYDHVFVTGEQAGEPEVREVARISSVQSGLSLTVLTDQPAIVVYTGNWISDRLVGKYRIQYGNYAAVALETQRFANAANIPQFRDQVIVTRERPFVHNTIYHIESL
ncbi:hypothetical protein IWW51_001777 [Coemansia sp. RSA 2702]|nr:hypothetical protein IWW51_001777 [Coemansia sp. RSA 2702]KAJ2359855.1 hypothetical protein H4S01_005982 [Coemansia sp. RSA 2610]